MKAHFRIFLNAHKKPNAERVLSRFLALIEADPSQFVVESNTKGGFIASGHIEIAARFWPEMVVALIARSQIAGFQWQLSGAIEEEIDLWSDETRVSGVEAIHVQCMRNS